MKILPRSITRTLTFSLAYGDDAASRAYAPDVALLICDDLTQLAAIRKRFPSAWLGYYVHTNRRAGDPMHDGWAAGVEGQLVDRQGAPIVAGGVDVMDPSSLAWIDATAAHCKAVVHAGADGIFLDTALMTPAELAPAVPADDPCWADWTAREVAFAGAVRRGLGAPLVANCGGRPGWDALALLVDGVMWEAYIGARWKDGYAAGGTDALGQLAQLQAGIAARGSCRHLVLSYGSYTLDARQRDYCTALQLLAASPFVLTSYQRERTATDTDVPTAAADDLSATLAALGPTATDVDGLKRGFVGGRVAGDVDARTGAITLRGGAVA